ncbi:uncharacterized protein LOC130782661 [Actinidia eriantha]|uniref:uncharacterized protein LOC130782661 n=1 Tax=Actinidia eriantha TaxID=165200 RepID=UPI0025872713|nr:uncharacterized protein LOC130782661 [Actinidia eriantha]
MFDSVWSFFRWTIQWLGSYLYEDRRSPMLLGFFLQPHIEEFHEAQPTTQFLWTSDQEKDVREGKWGAFDASLSMIGQTVYIVASSNGFLLCSIERKPQMHYCVCNPLTKEWVALPKPLKIYKYVALAFICKGNHTSLDGVHFTVVRAGVSNPRKRSTELEVETFSSDTGEWKESTVLCTSPFSLAVSNRPGFVVDKIIYWKDLRSLLVAYNPTKKCVDLIELPGDAQNGVCWGELFGLSEGVIHYARHNNFYLEVWVLKKAQWERTHKLSFARMFRQHGLNEYKGLSVKAFHPFDSRRMMFTWHGRPLWFDLESRKADIVSHHPICNQLLYDYFVYEGRFGSSASY